MKSKGACGSDFQSVPSSTRRVHLQSSAVALLLALMPLMVFRVGLAAPYFPDEYAHYDVVASVADGRGLPDRYSQVSSTTADLFACTDLSKGAPLVCGELGQSPDRMPWLGENAATTNLGAWYLASGVFAKYVSEWTGFELLTSARLLSIGWTLLLVLLVVALVLAMGGNPRVAVACAVLASCNPLVLAQSMVVQTDVPAAVLIVAGLVLAIRIAGWGPRLVWANAFVLCSLLVRSSGILAVALVGTLEWSARPGPRRMARASSPLLAVVAWLIILRLETATRGRDQSNGLQNSYVATVWDQRVGHAIWSTWSEIPLALTYPFDSSAVRPAASWLDAGAVILVIGALSYLIWVSLGKAAVAGRFVRPIALVTAGFILLFPPLTIVGLRFMGLPLFFQPRYLLPAAVVSLSVLAVSPNVKLQRVVQLGAAAVWSATVLAVIFS